MRNRLGAGVALLMVLAGCGTLDEDLPDYRPVIQERGVDLQRYEGDRQACEAQARRSHSNHEPTGVMRFRQCLLDKGYRLMS